MINVKMGNKIKFGVCCGLFNTEFGKKLSKLTRYNIKKISIHTYHVGLHLTLITTMTFAFFLCYYLNIQSYINTPKNTNTTMCNILESEFNYDVTKFLKFDLVLKYSINQTDINNKTIYKNSDYTGIADPFNYNAYKCKFKKGTNIPCSYDLKKVYLSEMKNTYWYVVGIIISSLTLSIFIGTMTTYSFCCYCCLNI
jgi:hypothetical protein